jgi:hypothetical protein
MSAQQLKEAAIAIYGDRGWQVGLASAMGVDVSSVRRWTSGSVDPPLVVAVAARGLLHAKTCRT